MVKKVKRISIFLFSIMILNMCTITNVEAVSKKKMYINARAAVALDANTKQVLYGKNSESIIPMASTTKIMTSLVALKYGNLDEKIIISKNASKIRGSKVGYKEGEGVSLKELLYGLMLKSGNDAAIAISEGIAGSVEKFVALMNEYAVSIGACNTHFESPHGLDSDNHYCTAYELALITSKAKEIPLFNQIVSCKSIDKSTSGFTRSYRNINKILWQIPGANGVKTGYTGNAGKCLVTSVKLDNSEIVIVILNSNTRWKETRKIYDFVKSNYGFVKIASKGQIMDTLKIDEKSKVDLCSSKDIIVPVKKGTNYYKKVIKPRNCIKDSLVKGEQIGSLVVCNDNKETLYKTSLVCKDNLIVKPHIKRFRFFDKIKEKFSK
ncbi:D-alanyl-D-alanine carboxypeptidase family protein [Haloimpatiens sp. FM7330]|uniref:D-alanyl-D-alanine carboxypeptidase family protein n=1 Tax=Haloimpatiens sp. FM7330 TaxID=3298610 RepID=UPI00362F7954